MQSLIGFCFALLLSGIVHAQTTRVKGVVTDVRSGETLPFVSVVVPGTTIGTATDADGKYNLDVPPKYNRIKFSYVGYLGQEKTLAVGAAQTLNVKLAVDATLLKEVTVKGKSHYRNRDNPAVQLIRQVIDHKEQNRMGSYPFVEYQQYEKIALSLNNLSDRFRNRRIFRNYQFLFTDADSAATNGKNSLPAYLEEKVSQVYLRKDPAAKKQVVKADRRVQFDPRFVDNKGLSKYFNRLYTDLNIYDNNLSVATNQLLSPIASTAPTFYKFFIRDTVKTQTPWLIELGFVPRNKTDLLFEGKLFVTLDNNYAVQNAYLTVNKDINLNYLKDLEAQLEFEKSTDGRYRPTQTTLAMEFAVVENAPSVYGRRVVSFQNYQVNQPEPDGLYKGPAEEIAYTQARSETYWDTIRPVPLDKVEAKIYHNIDTLQTIPSFRRTMSYATLLIAGYKNTGPFEIGPVNTFYSFNPVEGFRLRFGGRTTTTLSKRMYAETYAAYGFKDQKWKYFLSGTYSINNQSVYAFPLHYVRASFQKDTKIPGQDMQFVQEDNFLLSFKRGQNNRWLYNEVFRLEYVKEFENHLSYKLGFNRLQQRPAGILEYTPNLPTDTHHTYGVLNNTDLNLEVRYAPFEQFYQGKLYRTPIVNPYPIFTLRYNTGLKLFGGEYQYHNLAANVEKRIYLSQFGYIDATAEGGYTFGRNIPFPLLTIHRANQTYAYQLNAYNLMNFLEFVSDHYASVNFQYYLNGFVFNKVPLLKHLKLREVVSFKALTGGLRDANDPARGASVYRFPVDEQGQSVSYTLGRVPYMEASVGIANIFKLLRVDLVRRLTYLDHPNVSDWGIRGRFKFDF